MKSLTAEKDYRNAAAIADTINWNKVKNVNALVKAGEIYENAGRYEESREILLAAYDRSPIGRMIIYRLAKVAIKMKNYDEAFKSRMLFNIGISLPNREERIALWKFHVDSNMPKSISYEELADLSDGLSGRNIRQIAMTMGIRLTVGKIKIIEKSIIEIEVEKIKSAIRNVTEKSEKVDEKDLPKSVLNHL